MDLQLGPQSRKRILVRPEEGFRAVMEQAPRAEAVAAEWVERTRPGWSWLAREWRLVGTVASGLVIVVVLAHAIFGANGILMYRQKRAEMLALQEEVGRLQKQNEQNAETIKQLKSNPGAIEKEARERLHYSRPGEVIFVTPQDSSQLPKVQKKN
jgi:cell division protein FtsB